MQPLQRTINRIEKSVYEKGINVALYNAEHSKTFTSFKAQLQRALFYQIEKVASTDTIDHLLLLTKGPNPALIVAIGVALGREGLGQILDMGAFLVWAGQQGGQAFLDKAGIDARFLLKNQELVNYFDDYSRLLINSVDDYTKKWIAQTVQKGKDQMLHKEEIVRMLMDEGKGLSKLRAERIVITETARAMTVVENEVSKSYGIMEKTWRTSIDDRVCPICLPMEGETVRIGQLFSEGVEGPPAHVTCRCFLEDVIPADWEVPANGWLGE